MSYLCSTFIQLLITYCCYYLLLQIPGIHSTFLFSPLARQESLQPCKFKHNFCILLWDAGLVCIPSCFTVRPYYLLVNFWILKVFGFRSLDKGLWNVWGKKLVCQGKQSSKLINNRSSTIKLAIYIYIYAAFHCHGKHWLYSLNSSQD